MRMWATLIKAVDPTDGTVKQWHGPNVPGINLEDAEIYCQQNGLGYCEILGELECEIPCKEGTIEPDFGKMTDFNKIKYN